MKKKKKVIIGSTVGAGSIFALATWIIGNMVYDGTVGKSFFIKYTECHCHVGDW